MPGPGANSRTADVVLRDVEATRLRAQGMTFQAIADAMGDGHKATAKRRVDRVLDRVQVEAADELRANERAILESVRARLVKQFYADHQIVTQSGKVVDAIDVGALTSLAREIRQNSESLRKLDGLDAPSRSEVRVTDDLTAEIEQLAAELAAADRSPADRGAEGPAGSAQG